MKAFKFGPLALDPAEYGSQGNAVLGIRGSGKSYTATELAERLFDAGVPFFAFDPTGIWRFLRVPGAGRGYPIVVAGGKDGDLPLTVAGTAAIVRAAMQGGVSLVFNLHDATLSKADWRRIVTQAVRTMLHENEEYGLRHVFIEEAAEFIPQRPIDWDVYAEIEKMARIGGNSRLGYTLINQRSQEVSKAVLELCENMFLHRQRGKNALESLEKWLDVAGASERKAIMDTMPDLPTGQCWAWIGGDDPKPPLLIKVPPKNSFHPDRRVMRGDDAATKAKPVDVGAFVSTMQGQLAVVLEEAKANDPTALKRRIRELEAEVTRKPAPVIDRTAIDREVAQALEDGFVSGFNAAQNDAVKAIQLLPGRTFQRVDIPHTPRGGSPTPSAPQVTRPAPPPPRQPGGDTGGKLAKAERLILTVLAQRHPERLPIERIAAIAGYSAGGGGFNNALSSLRGKAFIEQGPSPLAITRDGLMMLGDFDPLPTGRALLAYWMGRVGKAERAILEAASRGHSTKEEIASAAGYAADGGGFNNALGRLRTLGLITGRGTIELHEDLQ